MTSCMISRVLFFFEMSTQLYNKISVHVICACYQNVDAVRGHNTDKDRTTHTKVETGVSESVGHRQYPGAQTALQ